MKNTISLLLWLLFCGCAYKPISKEIKQKFVNKIDAKGTEIEKQLNINGYYMLFFREKSSSGYGKYLQVTDSTPVNVIFFSDGTFSSSFFFNDSKDEKEQKFPIVNNELEAGYWGAYRIVGDTIIVQYLSHASLMAPWVFIEEHYKIIDHFTLKLINRAPMLERDIKEYGTNIYNEGLDKYSLAHFVKTEKLPPADNWLKKEEWLWATKSDWENYMRRKTKKKIK